MNDFSSMAAKSDFSRGHLLFVLIIIAAASSGSSGRNESSRFSPFTSSLIIHPPQRRLQSRRWKVARGTRWKESAIGAPPSKSSFPACPKGDPIPGRLRVVSDITRETDVKLLSDTFIPQRFQSPPQPILANQGSLAPLCATYGWRFCPSPRRGKEDHDWYKCEARQFVAKISCGYIDNQKIIPGMVYDHTRTFPVHGCHPHQQVRLHLFSEISVPAVWDIILTGSFGCDQNLK
jgi:hypothetical protein